MSRTATHCDAEPSTAAPALPLADAASTSPQLSAEGARWAVHTRSGLVLSVPPSLRSLSTYVLLEQERWFEPEMSLLPHVLAGGMHALDIGGWR